MCAQLSCAQLEHYGAAPGDDALARLSGRSGFEPVIVVQAAENRGRCDLRVGWPSMAVRLQRDGQAFRRGGDRRTERGVRAATVVVLGPLAHDVAQVPLAQGNHEVQRLAAHRADEAFAEGIRFRRTGRGFQDGNSQATDSGVELGGEDGVPVVNQVVKGMIRGDGLAQLLGRPRRARVLGDIHMEDLSRGDLHHHEHIEASCEVQRNDSDEVTGHNGPGVIAHEGSPALIETATRRGGSSPGPVFAHWKSLGPGLWFSDDGK